MLLEAVRGAFSLSLTGRELHHELVPFDARLAQRISDRAVRILQATDAGEPPPRIATTRDFHERRMCPWAGRCWGLPT